MSTPVEAELKRPDSAGRITIGKENAGKLFAVQRQPNGDILLSPVVVRHEREAWLYANPEAMAMVDRGLADSSAGRTRDGGDFTKFLDEPDDEE